MGRSSVDQARWNAAHNTHWEKKSREEFYEWHQFPQISLKKNYFQLIGQCASQYYYKE